MATVSLEGMRFYGYHGVYAEEADTGTWFEVDVEVQFPWPDDLARLTINYEDIYNLTREIMNRRKELLEELVELIIGAVRQKFSEAQDIRVRIKKANPPLGGEVRFAVIEHIDHRD